MRCHVHEEIFAATPERLFALLVTPSAIREWWSARTAVVLPEKGGYWMASWGDSEDEPEYVSAARLVEYDPPRRLAFGDARYHARPGPLPFEASFVTTFEVEPHPDGAVLRVTQDGFPDDPVADDFYAACKTGWRDTFAGMRRYLDAD